MNKGVIKLLSGIVLIIVLVGFVVPKINQSSTNPVMQFVNKNDLDAGVLFYTESEVGLEATLNLADANILLEAMEDPKIDN